MIISYVQKPEPAKAEKVEGDADHDHEVIDGDNGGEETLAPIMASNTHIRVTQNDGERSDDDGFVLAQEPPARVSPPEGQDDDDHDDKVDDINDHDTDEDDGGNRHLIDHAQNSIFISYFRCQKGC